MLILFDKKLKGLYTPFYPSSNTFTADPFKLYESAFDNLGLGVLRDFTSNPLITEILNGDYYLEFEYALNGHLAELIEEEKIIKANGQLFRIKNVDKNTKSIKVLAKHIIYDLNNNFLEDVAPSVKTAKEALDWVLARTQFKHNFTAESDISTVKSARYVRKNLLEVLLTADNSFTNVWGGEFEFDNLKIKLHNQRGQDRGLQIRYGKNLTGIEFKLDFNDVATRIMPQGTNELILPEKYIDSPLLSTYHNPIIRKVELDIGIDKETTEEQAYELMRQAVQDLFDKGLDKPKISINVDFIELSKTEEYKQYANLEQAFLGDTVSVYVSKLNLNLKARIVRTTYDCIKKRFTKLEIGQVSPNFVKSSMKKQNQLSANVNSKVGKGEIISAINQSDEEIGIIAKKINLEGITTINQGFIIDEQGNMTANNATINGNIFMPNSDTKIIGGQGLLTNLEYIGRESGTKASGNTITSGGYSLLGFMGQVNGDPNTKTSIVFDFCLPENFAVKEAKVTLNHFPLQVLDSNNAVAGWGYARKLRLYKSFGLQTIYRQYTPASEWIDIETESYTEINGAMGDSGYTPAQPNDTAHVLEIFISQDISSELTTGINKLKVESGETTPTASATETNLLNCALMSGMATATLNIIGYYKF